MPMSFSFHTCLSYSSRPCVFSVFQSLQWGDLAFVLVGQTGTTQYVCPFIVIL